MLVLERYDQSGDERLNIHVAEDRRVKQEGSVSIFGNVFGTPLITSFSHTSSFLLDSESLEDNTAGSSAYIKIRFNQMKDGEKNERERKITCGLKR
jgi:hypothetical protein